MKQSIAVVIPCYNEEQTIAKVVRDFRAELPKADVYVFDNNSTDKTIERAKSAGAIIRHVKRKGKGAVMQAAFESLSYDLLVVVDGDDTYPAEAVHELLKPVADGKVDMMVGSRLQGFKKEKKGLMHRIGNHIILWALYFCFPVNIKDMLSGYRVMSRELVGSLNLLSTGFAIETELTIKTLENGFRIGERPIAYRERPKGSESKLDSWSDGMYIITTVVELFRDHRPMQFFLAISIIPFALASGFGYVVMEEVILSGGNVTKYGSLVMTVFFALITLLLMSMGFIASSVRKSHLETMHMLNKMKLQRR